MSRTRAMTFTDPDLIMLVDEEDLFPFYFTQEEFQVQYASRSIHSIINRQHVRIKLVQDQIVRFRKLKKPMRWLVKRELGIKKYSQ